MIAVFFALFLTSFWFPAMAVVMASGLLAGAWAHAKRRWPSDPSADPRN
jgi:hypothetical protein